MKNAWHCLILAVLLQPAGIRNVLLKKSMPDVPVNRNLLIITTDGFRWQELFNGADSVLINDDSYTPDKETVKALYWAGTADERRKRLMPFVWNVMKSQGQLYGNRLYDNKINTANFYSISYPGYNELLTGNIDPEISSNHKTPNPNRSVLEYLNQQPDFSGQVAVFSSWDVFPYILNEQRSHIPVNSGYENISGPGISAEQEMINRVQDEGIKEKEATRYDELTFLTAKNYIIEHHPRVVYIGFGETDECAHRGRYDLYLDRANAVDRMIASLWHLIQTTPGYRDNTTLLITTDHGRGNKHSKWTSHGPWISGSSQVWFGMMGPGIQPLGEIKEPQQYYLVQLTDTIQQLLGAGNSAVNNATLALLAK
ncbi:MAG: alkaline phosphatase family protein [Chitinophagaceae bacterium]